MLAPGTVIGGRYRLVSSISSGGMADVYEAQDERLGRSVAIKVLRQGDAGLSRRFADEVRTLAQLNDPGIVALYDADEYEGHAFFVMELVRGRPLADALTEGALEPRRCATIAASVTKGLAQAHAAGIIHRDVKPANIMVTDDGAKLADFGIARMTGTQSDLTQDGTVIRTAAYLSPEQAEGKEISPATDIYSLGLVLIEALTAQRVFEGTATEAVVARLTRDPQVPDALPGNWGEILSAMTARDPLARPLAETLAPMFAALASDETVPIGAAATAVMVGAAGGAAASTEVLGAGGPAPAAGTAAIAASETGPGTPGDHAGDRRKRNIAIAIAVLVGVLLVGGIAWAITSGTSTTTTTTTTTTPTTVAPQTTSTMPETTTTERPTTTKATTTTSTTTKPTTTKATTTKPTTTKATTTTKSTPPTTS